jgi:hypothetical protein
MVKEMRYEYRNYFMCHRRESTGLYCVLCYTDVTNNNIKGKLESGHSVTNIKQTRVCLRAVQV